MEAKKADQKQTETLTRFIISAPRHKDYTCGDGPKRPLDLKIIIIV